MLRDSIGEGQYDTKTMMVCIGGKQLAMGIGDSKATAKHNAALKSLVMLDPAIDPEIRLEELENVVLKTCEGDARFSEMLLKLWMCDGRMGQLPAFEFDRFSDGSYCAQGLVIVNNVTTLSAVGKGLGKAEAMHDAAKLLLSKLFPGASSPEAALVQGAATVQTLVNSATAAHQQMEARGRGEGASQIGGYAYGNSEFENGEAQGGAAGMSAMNGALEPNVMAQHYSGYIEPIPNSFDGGLGLRANAPVFYSPPASMTTATSAPNAVAFNGVTAAMAMSQTQAMVMASSTAVPSNTTPAYEGMQPPPPPLVGGPPPLGPASAYAVNTTYSGETPGVPPPNFLCPISGRLMSEPVIADDG